MSETARYLDLSSGTIVEIPAAELAPGAVWARVEGVEGEVWVLAEGLTPGDYQHPPFDEEIRELIQRIQSAFAEHCPQSVEWWEDGFRRDLHARREIELWLHTAAVYQHYVDERERTAAERAEAFQVLGACMNSTPETVWRVVSLSVLSREPAQGLVDGFFGGWPG